MEKGTTPFFLFCGFFCSIYATEVSPPSATSRVALMDAALRHALWPELQPQGHVIDLVRVGLLRNVDMLLDDEVLEVADAGSKLPQEVRLTDNEVHLYAAQRRGDGAAVARNTRPPVAVIVRILGVVLASKRHGPRVAVQHDVEPIDILSLLHQLAHLLLQRIASQLQQLIDGIVEMVLVLGGELVPLLVLVDLDEVLDVGRGEDGLRLWHSSRNQRRQSLLHTAVLRVEAVAVEALAHLDLLKRRERGLRYPFVLSIE